VTNVSTTNVQGFNFAQRSVFTGFKLPDAIWNLIIKLKEDDPIALKMAHLTAKQAVK